MQCTPLPVPQQPMLLMLLRSQMVAHLNFLQVYQKLQVLTQEGYVFFFCRYLVCIVQHLFAIALASFQMGMALRNPRHRRSRSAEGTGRWLDHCPATPVPLNTVFQPNMKKRKSITKLTDVKDITKGTERYCLTTQEQDTDGELETRLYKVCNLFRVDFLKMNATVRYLKISFILLLYI